MTRRHWRSVAWSAQAALAVGLVLTTAALLGPVRDAGSSVSFVAVMGLLLVAAVVVWRRFGFGLPVVLVDLAFALLAFGMANVTVGGSGAAATLQTMTTALWLVGGVVGMASVPFAGRGGPPAEPVEPD